jgi:hypothetical protein
MMKLRHAAALLVGSFAIARSVTPTEALCAILSVDDEFKGSSAVFVGRAIAQAVATTPTAFWSRATETTFEVEDVWKGDSGKTVRIRTCGGTVGKQSVVCPEAFHFVVGSRYLVFAEGQQLVTDICHRTALVDRAKETLQWLSNKPLKKAR